MSDTPPRTLRRRGEQLAEELDQFIKGETADTQDAAEVLRGAFEYFDRRTRQIRGEPPWPPEAGEVQPKLSDPN